MEVGEMDREEPQIEVHWSPDTPIKSVPLQPVPIYTAGERNQMGHHANGAVACAEFSLGQHKIGGLRGGSNVACDSDKKCEQAVSDAVSGCSKLGFCEQLFAVEAESRNSSVTQQGNNEGLNNPVVPSFNHNVQDPQEIHIALDDVNTDLNKTPLLKSRRKKHRPKVVREDKPNRTRKPAAPKPVQSKENPPVKRKYVRKRGLKKTSPAEETGELTKEASCKRSLNFDIDTHSAAIENTAALLGKENGVLAQETNVGPAFDLNNSVKQASKSYMSLPEDTQVLNTSPLGRNSSGTKPAVKRKYTRSKQVNMTEKMTKENIPEPSKISCAGIVNFDERGRIQSYAVQGNPIEHPSTEIGVVMQDINVGFSYDLNTVKKQASNSYISLPEDTRAPNTSSTRKGSATKPEENPPPKRKYVRRKGVNKTSALPIGVPGELASAQTDQSYAVKESPNGHSAREIGVIRKEMNVGLAYDLNTSMKQALNDEVALPKDAKALSSPSKIKLPGTETKENMSSKRKNARKKGLNPFPIPPTEMTELTEAMMLESNMSWRSSLNFDTGTRDGSYVGTENFDLHIGKEKMALEETQVGLTYNQNTCMKEPLNNFLPSTSISECTSLGALGAKLNANSVQKRNKKGRATAQGGSISNGQSSTIRLQLDQSKRKHSGTYNPADESSMNLIGVHYNGLSSYQTSISLQFPKVQKKRRTEKGKTSNTYDTFVTATKEVQQTCPQEYALGHSFASTSNFWTYGSGYNRARVPDTSGSTENLIDNSQTFDEFVSSLKRLTERSQTSTCDLGSQTRVRNCDIEPIYTAKEVGISGSETFWDAKTCTGALVAETCTPPTKKKRNRKKSVRSSSAHSTTNEMLQHHNFTLENYPLPMGKSSGIVPEVLWNTMNNIDALILQFSRLNINTEARDLAFHEQNALVPYKQQNSLIHGDGAIVPFPIKKQHVRPRVNLDDETDRVWKLLLLDINSHGIDGTDEDKAKWWEEERNVFRGRADSFIARMHLVQGDRRFSRWKGSVVDSVVGVFLTQNVSDHLSSSAFMSLAARYSKKSSSMCEPHHVEDTRLVVDEPRVHIVELEESTECNMNFLDQSVYNQTFPTKDIVEHAEEKEATNNNESCGTTSSVSSLTDESNSRFSERNIKEDCSPLRSGLPSAMIEDIVSSQGSAISSQISGDFPNDQNPEKIGSCSDSNSEVEVLSSTAKYNHFHSNTSFSKLLEMVSSTKFYEDNTQKGESIENFRDAYDQPIHRQHSNPIESLKKSSITQGSSEAPFILSHDTLKLTHNSGMLEVNFFDPFRTEASTSDFLKKKDENDMNRSSLQTTEPAGQVPITHSQSIVSQVHPQEQCNHQQQSLLNISGQTQDFMQKERGSALGEHKNAMRNGTNEISASPTKLKSKEQGKEKKNGFNWDSLRIEAQAKAGKREKTENTMDSLDWDAVRCADVNEIAETIKERGMNNRLADRIKNFLNRLVEDHGSIDLEWLRDVPPDKAKEYLLSVRGLGLKSVECVRLLTLHHLAFPVDTNVGRIAVRLGWVPLQPLPESLQLHLLEMYPVLESIQKYLWPRLCKLDQKTLYELHYQMITFGKVFCTKNKPNCNACPMRGECRHFASAFASARLALPGPEQKSIVTTAGNTVIDQNPSQIINQLHLPPPENTAQAEETQLTEVSRQLELKSEINICQPIIEEPTTPEPECSQISQTDIEDAAFYEDSSEIPTIKLNIEEFTLNLQNYMQENMELQEGEMSKALVALNPEAASIPMPKLKNMSRLRTEHCVYELPDTHPLLQGWDTRETDDPGKYLLAIWTPGETANSIQPPESKCSSQEECGQLCNEKECFSCNSFREANSQIVRGTILIPCRTAMRGSFPLNGTYFQVNEVFADHESSLNPISVPRSWIWNLSRRTVYFGTSVPTIFKGLTTPEIQQCFWRGYVCVRGFDRETRAPRPLMARLHFPASKLSKTKKEKIKKEKTKKEVRVTRSRRTKLTPKEPELVSNNCNLQQTGKN